MSCPSSATKLLLCALAISPHSSATNLTEASLPVERAHSGAYFDPAATGQGLFVEVVIGAQGEVTALAAPWFTFSGDQDSGALASEQRWYLLYGEISDDPIVVDMAILRSQGGRRDLEGSSTLSTEGSASMQWISCDRALLNYSFNNGVSGDIVLERITAGDCDTATNSARTDVAFADGGVNP